MICTTKWILQGTGHRKKFLQTVLWALKQRYNPVFPFWIIVPGWSSQDDYSRLESKYDLIIEKLPEPYTRLLKHLKGTDYLWSGVAIYTDS